MKKSITILLCLLNYFFVTAQYYYRGEIKDESGKPISNATVYLHSSKTMIHTGSGGAFGIMSTKTKTDTFTFITENFEKASFPVFENQFNTIKLKLLARIANLQKNRLTTAIKDFKLDKNKFDMVSSETYSNLVENQFVNTESYPTTGFAINSDKASYANIRRFINSNGPVPVNAVRIDEMVNYFGLGEQPPNDSAVFNISSQLTQCPWNNDNLLLFLNVTAKKINLANVPPSHLVFLIDNSGSMELQNRMALLKSSFKALIKNLRDEDKITIITYGGGVTVLTEALSGSYQDSLIKVVESMEASGDTPGENAILTAYNKAKLHFIIDGNNRIILATDGDFNVGIADEIELERLIVTQSQAGVYLTCLGLGMGNYKDSKLEVLAKKGRGNFAYLDTEQEAEIVMVKELTQTLYSVADQVFMSMQFEKKWVNQYRLLGYDNKITAVADTASKLEGGQIGSGYSSMVLFEITPAINVDSANLENALGDVIGNFSITYTDLNTKTPNSLSAPCVFNFKPLLSLPNHYGFAAAVAMFGSYIKESKYVKKFSIEDIKNLVTKTIDETNNSQKEFFQILDKAERIYEPNAKKKRKKQLSAVNN